jgi:hypothetical protein
MEIAKRGIPRIKYVLLLLFSTLTMTALGAVKQTTTEGSKVDFGLLKDGIYRLESCGIWPRCLEFAEHMGFTNKSCSGDRRPPVVLRDFSRSKRWKTWNVTFSNLEKSSIDATFQAFWPKSSGRRPRCDGGYVGDERPSASCKKERESPLFFSKAEPQRVFRIRPSDAESGCVHVYDPKRENAGCPSLFAAEKDCAGDLNVVLESKDDGSFRHRWQLVYDDNAK